MRFDAEEHAELALWAADCAEHVQWYFEEACPGDARPRDAIAAARAWARGEITVSEARRAALAAHAAAREVEPGPVRAAARAAGHAAATAQVAGHARHAASYAVTAAGLAAHLVDPGIAAAAERDWQEQRLGEHLRTMFFPGADAL